MTAKDYNAIAGAIQRARQGATDPCRPVQDAMQAAIDLMVGEIATMLAADNTRFDRARFVNACEGVMA